MPMTPEQQLLRELYSMEVDRIKYILRAYLRARLYKVQLLSMIGFSLVILTQIDSSRVLLCINSRLQNFEHVYPRTSWTLQGGVSRMMTMAV